MSAYAFVNYVRFKTQADAYTGTPYQNFSINEQRVYDGITYSFAPFAISSGGGARGGDRSSASLVAGTDACPSTSSLRRCRTATCLRSKPSALIR